MTNEKFCLRWNDFESNISVAFQELRDDKDFFDVTLACDDEQIQAHKMILSACSAFFRNILRRNPHPHPLLYLKGVKYTDLQSILNFMYHGEVNVAQEELNSFLTVAEDLQVKGLTQTNTANQHEKLDFSQPKSTTQRKPHPNPPSPTQQQLLENRPSKNSHHQTHAHSQELDDTIQAELPVKTEPRDYPPPLAHAGAHTAVHPAQDINPASSQSLACVEDDGYGYQDDQHAEYEHYEDGQFGAAEVDMVDYAVDEGNTGVTDRNSLLKYITQNSVGAGASFQCTLCGKTNRQKNNVMKHVESIHFPGSFTHYCNLCDKTVKTKSALEWHNTQYHSKKQKYPKAY